MPIRTKDLIGLIAYINHYCHYQPLVYFLQVDVYFLHRKRKMAYYATFGLFWREFTHFLVYFYRPKYCGGVPKFTNKGEYSKLW